MALKNAPAVAKSMLPANLEKQMREDAAKGAKRAQALGGGAQFMSIRGGILTFQQTPVPGNKMLAVILGDIFENAWYKEEFDQDNPVPPNCYAFGDEVSDLAPHEQAEDKQNDTCAGCEKNKFGSAEKGRGKACKNMVRMALMHADSLKGNITKDAQIAFLKIPPTSATGPWKSYCDSLDKLHGRPPYGVITEVSLVPDIKTQYKVVFTHVKNISDKKQLAAIYMKRQEMLSQLAQPYQPIDASALKKPAKSKKGGGKQQQTRQAPAQAQQRAGGRGRF
jgi:hypothetical protein